MTSDTSAARAVDTRPGADDEVDDRHRTKPFAAVLQEMNGGKTHRELSEGLQDLVRQVLLTGKKGKITLTIDVEEMGSNRVQIKDAVKITKPEPTRESSIFYATQGANLQRTDPNQPQIEGLVEVSRPDHADAIRVQR